MPLRHLFLVLLGLVVLSMPSHAQRVKNKDIKLDPLANHRIRFTHKTKRKTRTFRVERLLAFNAEGKSFGNTNREQFVKVLSYTNDSLKIEFLMDSLGAERTDTGFTEYPTPRVVYTTTTPRFSVARSTALSIRSIDSLSITRIHQPARYYSRYGYERGGWALMAFLFGAGSTIGVPVSFATGEPETAFILTGVAAFCGGYLWLFIHRTTPVEYYKSDWSIEFLPPKGSR